MVAAVRGETIIVERDGGIVTVTLNRPERKNAANGAMWQELYATVQEVARSRDDRVLVITGAGGAFCSGADIGDPKGISGDSEDPPLTRMRFLGSVMLALYDLPKPTIAKVRGIAAGAGLSLALCCDLTVVSSDARLSEIFSKRGLSVDGGSSWLQPELDAFVDDWATRLAAGPPIARSMSKKLLNNSAAVSMAQALEDEARCQTVNFTTEDTREAMRAFAEKRSPKFLGR
jgi:2-(1,2-epoxy-1,2-dihydrophenyl)acetyl-CoA isomerase